MTVVGGFVFLSFFLLNKDMAKTEDIFRILQFKSILFLFSINLLASYHECRSQIGYATYYLFCDR